MAAQTSQNRIKRLDSAPGLHATRGILHCDSSLVIDLNELMSFKDFEYLRMFDRINKSYEDANDLSIE